MEQLIQRVGFQYQGVCADSGYDCVENYQYLDENRMASYIKTQTYERSKKRSFRKDPGNKLNMSYDERLDQLRCMNNTILHNTGRKKRGINVYQAKKGCVSCTLRNRCMKSQSTRQSFNGSNTRKKLKPIEPAPLRILPVQRELNLERTEVFRLKDHSAL